MTLIASVSNVVDVPGIDFGYIYLLHRAPQACSTSELVSITSNSPLLHDFVIALIKKSVKLSIVMLFVRMLLFSFVLALSVAGIAATWSPSVELELLHA